MEADKDSFNKDLVEAIWRAVQSFELQRNDGISTKICSIKDGQFIIYAKKDLAAVMVEHGWNDHRRSFDNPGIISVVLSDRKSQVSYCIYMTECELSSFPELLNEAQIITENFLNNNYQIMEPKVLGIPMRTYIKFNNDGLHYSEAAQTKKFTDLSFLDEALQIPAEDE